MSAIAIRRAIPGCPHQPYAHYRDLSEERLERYFVRALERSASRPGVWSRGDEESLVELEELEWDSGMLEKRAARLNWLLAPGPYEQARERKGRLLAAALEEAARRGIEHLTVRVAAEDLSSLHALEAAGFLTVDTILTFARASGPEPAAGAVRAAELDDIPALRRMAERSFRYDRYHADPTIPKAVADHLHGEWVENSVRGFADAVLVVEGPEGPAGFTTIQVDPWAKELLGVSIAAIVLVATAPEARRQGVAGRLARAAVGWCEGRGIERVEVGTQLRNVAACRVYAGAGFGMVGSSVSLRWSPGA